ncbi:hypothetical protein [Psychrobacter urativorans]|uniref:Lipoprotein n=1 Tax=Psychrobacter urativorans TaxID=45610 RepID=A0A0M4U5D6_9GAMM|nr:hypothetical protein [Psychrobacter urativorans]ALF60119.1 hypothetical protein AOC03_08775 [Psychrobacter urativorans]
MSITKVFLASSLFVCLLTACVPKQTEDDSDESAAVAAYTLDAVTPDTVDPAEDTANPCLSKWVIQGMKDKIIEQAVDNIQTNYSSNTLDTSVVYDTDIEFSYITKATELESGGWSCSAQANVTYIGNRDSSGNLATQIAKMMNANAFTFSNMGITPYNINEFREIRGNNFSVPIDYKIKTTYAESGEEQQSYHATIGRASAMLAVITALDNRVQQNEARNARYAEQAALGRELSTNQQIHKEDVPKKSNDIETLSQRRELSANKQFYRDDAPKKPSALETLTLAQRRQLSTNQQIYKEGQSKKHIDIEAVSSVEDAYQESSYSAAHSAADEVIIVEEPTK